MVAEQAPGECGVCIAFCHGGKLRNKEINRSFNTLSRKIGECNKQSSQKRVYLKILFYEKTIQLRVFRSCADSVDHLCMVARDKRCQLILTNGSSFPLVSSEFPQPSCDYSIADVKRLHHGKPPQSFYLVVKSCSR